MSIYPITFTQPPLASFEVGVPILYYIQLVGRTWLVCWCQDCYVCSSLLYRPGQINGQANDKEKIGTHITPTFIKNLGQL